MNEERTFELHPHLTARMRERGVSQDEIARTLAYGWEASDAKPGVLGKVMVFTWDAEWEGQVYSEKEVTVYYKRASSGIVVLTVKARYGTGFRKG